MSPQRDCSEDRIARAKRGVLTESQERELRDLLATSAEARLLYEAGAALDRDACVVAGDDARLERIACQVQKRYVKRAVPLPLRGARRGIAAALLVAGVAVGAVGVARKVRHTPLLATAPADTSSKHGVTLRSRVPSEPSATDANSTPSVAMAVPPLATQRHPSADTGNVRSVAVPAGSASVMATVALPALAKPATGRFDDLERPTQPVEPPAETSAASLFAEANRARVRGDVGSAIREYERLLSHYPLSRESGAARISLGMLYVQQGQPEPALQQFRRYAATRGPLTAEALWGEAQALHLLGRTPEERVTLQRIVREFPDSPYATTAQGRLDP